jgi:hypothetical protein
MDLINFENQMEIFNQTFTKRLLYFYFICSKAIILLSFYFFIYRFEDIKEYLKNIDEKDGLLNDEISRSKLSTDRINHKKYSK